MLVCAVMLLQTDLCVVVPIQQHCAKFTGSSTADRVVLPGKSNVKAVLETETLLHGRSWKTVKDCVSNLVTKRHHPTRPCLSQFLQKI